MDTKETNGKYRLIVVAVLLILITIAISCVVYLYCREKGEDPYGPVPTQETEISLNSLKNKGNETQSQQSAADSYPEICASP